MIKIHRIDPGAEAGQSYKALTDAIDAECLRLERARARIVDIFTIEGKHAQKDKSGRPTGEERPRWFALIHYTEGRAA